LRNIEAGATSRRTQLLLGSERESQAPIEVLKALENFNQALRREDAGGVHICLAERKIGALDQAAPLVGWELPDEFATLRRLLEARLSKPGKREFVQVLRLLEVFGLEDVVAGVREAIARGVISFDAVKHLVLCRIERRPPRLNLQVYPYLPQATVATTLAKSYLSLMAGAGS
jgi:hypothetical protein